MKNIFITNIEKYKIWMSKKKSKDCLQETKKIIYVNNGQKCQKYPYEIFFFFSFLCLPLEKSNKKSSITRLMFFHAFALFSKTLLSSHLKPKKSKTHINVQIYLFFNKKN